MLFEKVAAHGGVAYQCLLFDNVTVAPEEYLDSEAFPMPPASGNYSVQISGVSDDGTASLVMSGSNIPGDDNIAEVSGGSIQTGITAITGDALYTFSLNGVVYPRVRIKNTSTTDPITLTVWLGIEAQEGNIDPSDYTTHIPCSVVQRKVKHKYRDDVSEIRLLDAINDCLRDIATDTEYFRDSVVLSLSTTTDEYKIADDLVSISEVYAGNGVKLEPITKSKAAEGASVGWETEQGTVEHFMTEGVTIGSIRPYPLPDTETQSLTVHYVNSPSPVEYLTEYIPVDRIYTKAIVDYVVAQLYGDDNDMYDQRKERDRLAEYFQGKSRITAQAAVNSYATITMPYRVI